MVDIESTGGAFYDEMIDIAVADIAERKIIYNKLIKPTTLINPHAFQVHRISYEMLRDAPYLAAEYSNLNKKLENKPIVTYNVAFDKRLLIQSYEKYELPLPENIQWECMMLACRSHFGKNIGLNSVADTLDIPRGTHRAKTDVITATKIIHKLAVM